MQEQRAQVLLQVAGQVQVVQLLAEAHSKAQGVALLSIAAAEFAVAWHAEAVAARHDVQAVANHTDAAGAGRLSGTQPLPAPT